MSSVILLNTLKIEWDYYELSGDSYVDHAKNALVHRFLQSDYTHILMIDSDLSWNVEGLGRLIKDALYGAEVVGGAYPNKNNWGTYGTMPLCKDNCVLGVDNGQIRMIETRGIPGGFIIYSREAFERARGSLQTYREKDEDILQCFSCSVENGSRVGEDIYFQRRYLENGGKVYLEPDITFKHYGVEAHEGNYHEYLLNNKTSFLIPKEKLSNLHVVMPFSRANLKEEIINLYKPYGVALYPIEFPDQCGLWNGEWFISPFVIDPCEENTDICYYKLNQFIKHHKIVDEDYYWFMCDDDSFEEDVISNIKASDSDVVMVSMKRGYNIPKSSVGRHPTSTLFAKPENMHECGVGLEQFIVKGKILKTLQFDENSHYADGKMAEHLKANYNVKYLENVFIKFNYYEGGRWD
jgi:hypothetical protein